MVKEKFKSQVLKERMVGYNIMNELAEVVKCGNSTYRTQQRY